MGSVALAVEGLQQSFGPEVAVRDLSLEVPRGTLTALLGPSGCGKTTTLRCIAGFEPFDAGRISIDGRLVSDPRNHVHVRPSDRDIGMVFQEKGIWPHMSVFDHIKFPLDAQDIGTEAARRRDVERMIELIDLEGFEDRLGSTLSGGQQQRVSLGRALITEPELVLFDEPLSDLDANLRLRLLQEIERLQRELQFSAVYVTHDQMEAMHVADTIAIMNDGQLVETNDPLGLYRATEREFSREFMDFSPTLVASGVSSDGETLEVEQIYHGFSKRSFELEDWSGLPGAPPRVEK